MPYTLPTPAARPEPAERTAYLVASGDLREPANVAGWPTQVELERVVGDALAEHGWTVQRANEVDQRTGHGFVSSQRMGLEVFSAIPPGAPLIVAEAIWQYSHHVLAGLRTHEGPILTVANFAGRWPGLVGLLGLNAGLTKMGRDYSTIWTVDGTDHWFREGVAAWLATGRIEHDASHVRDLPPLPDSAERDLGVALADQLLTEKAIIGVFDEGCMGMYNGIIHDELLNPLGDLQGTAEPDALCGPRCSRSTTTRRRPWGGGWSTPGMTFRLGTDEATELTQRSSPGSARCTSRRCGSRRLRSATPSASSTSRV